MTNKSTAGSGTACAQIRSQVEALGANFDPAVLAATRAIYRPHLDMSPAAHEEVDRVYGPHTRHRLDLYVPAGACEALVVFVHGGGFVAGDKNGDGVFYRNVGRWLAREGLIAVLPNYRLAPEAPWPAGAQDVGVAVAWARSHAALRDGRALPVFVLGQSAGASHVASWLFDPAVREGQGADVSGVMLMSGFYRAQAPLAPGPEAYFGADAAVYEARSPLTHVQRVETPLWISLAELDPAGLAAPSYALAQAVTLAQGHSPAFRLFAGHNHVSTVQSLGSPQGDVADAILAFIRAYARRT